MVHIQIQKEEIIIYIQYLHGKNKESGRERDTIIIIKSLRSHLRDEYALNCLFKRMRFL